MKEDQPKTELENFLAGSADDSPDALEKNRKIYSVFKKIEKAAPARAFKEAAAPAGPAAFLRRAAVPAAAFGAFALLVVLLVRQQPPREPLLSLGWRSDYKCSSDAEKLYRDTLYLSPDWRSENRFPEAGNRGV